MAQPSQDTEDEEKGFQPWAGEVARGYLLRERFFDIVNGFFNRCRGAWVMHGSGLPDAWMAYHALLTDVVVWLRLSSASRTTQALCRSDVDGVDSQA